MLARETVRPPAERGHRAREACADAHGPRHEMEIMAPPAVAAGAVAVFRALRDLRDGTADGAVAGDAAYERLTGAYNDAFGALRAAMRRDLAPDGVPAP
ncbi:hypothetical protein [Streptomyces sp. NPDC002067]